MDGQRAHWRRARARRPRRHPFGGPALALLILAGLAACAAAGGGGDESAHPAGSPSADGDTASTGGRTTGTAAPRPSGSPTRSGRIPGPGRPLPFATFWATRSDLAERTVTVDGTLRFDLVCPPPESTAGCVASAYLAADDVATLPPHPEEVAIRLYDHGQPVGCAADSISGLSCQGWRDGTRYRVTGVPRPPRAQGRQLPGLVFDAADHTTR